MPTFDGGHYFLTALAPVKTSPIPDGSAITSPVHALRKQLDLLPPAQQSVCSRGNQSPFAENTRNHFARFVIIDDFTYNGRETENTIWLLLRNALSKIKINLVVAQPQDHLTCPFLLFGAEFDAASGADAERDSYLVTLWDTMEPELRKIFIHCERFDSVNDSVSFAKYIASCQIETTMPFNDYYVDPNTVKNLPSWPADTNSNSGWPRRYFVGSGFHRVVFFPRHEFAAARRRGGVWFWDLAGLCDPHGGGQEAVSSGTGLESPDRSQGPPSATDFYPFRHR